MFIEYCAHRHRTDSCTRCWIACLFFAILFSVPEHLYPYQGAADRVQSDDWSLNIAWEFNRNNTHMRISPHISYDLLGRIFIFIFPFFADFLICVFSLVPEVRHELFALNGDRFAGRNPRFSLWRVYFLSFSVSLWLVIWLLIRQHNPRSSREKRLNHYNWFQGHSNLNAFFGFRTTWRLEKLFCISKNTADW